MDKKKLKGSIFADEYVDTFQIKTKKDLWQTKKEESVQILDVPLITVNKLVFRSQLDKGTYKPVEMLSYADIVNHLRKGISKTDDTLQTKDAHEEKEVQGKPSPSFMKKLQERKQVSLHEDDDVLPHPHPFNRNKRNTERIGVVNTLKARSVLLEMSDEIDTVDDTFKSTVNYNELEKKFENFMTWVNQAKQDYVAMETINSIEEFQILFKLLEKYTSPTLLQIKLNSNGTWTVVCQPLEDFKKDYMVLRIGLKYCLCLEPF